MVPGTVLDSGLKMAPGTVLGAGLKTVPGTFFAFFVLEKKP
jgi:hypothetical protein